MEIVKVYFVSISESNRYSMTNLGPPYRPPTL